MDQQEQHFGVRKSKQLEAWGRKVEKCSWMLDLMEARQVKKDQPLWRPLLIRCSKVGAALVLSLGSCSSGPLCLLMTLLEGLAYWFGDLVQLQNSLFPPRGWHGVKVGEGQHSLACPACSTRATTQGSEGAPGCTHGISGCNRAPCSEGLYTWFNTLLMPLRNFNDFWTRDLVQKVILYWALQIIWASLVALLVKNPPAMQETSFWFLVWEDSLEKGIPTPVFLGFPWWFRW